MASDRVIPVCPSNAAIVGYTIVRHIGLILDELSSQGLDLWRDERQCWHWRWLDTDLRTERGFWALGEALVDAVVARYPGVFATATDDSAASGIAIGAVRGYPGVFATATDDSGT